MIALIIWFIRHRFFCSECDRFLPRTRVRFDSWGDEAFCMWCGAPVYHLEDTLDEMVGEYTHFIVKRDREEDEANMKKYKEQRNGKEHMADSRSSKIR